MMTELRTWYRERLPGRITAIEEVIERYRKGVPESALAIRRIAHSLRGSGGTYGFPEISDQARVLEEAGEEGLLGPAQNLIETLRAACAPDCGRRLPILIVEDDEDQVRYIEETLGAPDRELLEARTAEEAQAILDQREVSLILLDLLLPDTDGRNFLARLRERFSTAKVPVIVLTVKRASQAKAECIALGVDDFIEKPVKAEVLREIVEARLRLGAGVDRDPGRDALTGLANRAPFHENFKRLRAGIACTREPAAAGILVLDGFDAISAEHGLGGAQAALRHAASVLSRTLRSTDFLARYGGGMFAALFPKTLPAGAAVALGKALQALRESPVSLGKGAPVALGFSAGIAPVAAGRILDDVLAEAHLHVHLAQETGGGRIVTAEDRIIPTRRKIVIADDDELIRLVLERLFEREGYDVVPCTNGREALEAARKEAPSLVITDGSMPVMDGFELVARLRALPECSSLPIVMLTSMASEDDVLRGFEKGADEYIFKPFSTAELLARTRRLFKRAGSRA